MQEILKPAIDLAENGFPVQKITAHSWKKGMLQVLQKEKEQTNKKLCFSSHKTTWYYLV